VIIDRIVAIVNDEVITLSELQEAILPFIKSSTDFVLSSDREKLQKQLLNKMIEKKLELQEARKFHITATNEEVEKTIKNIMEENGILSIEDLERDLELQGMSLDTFKKRLKEEIIIMKLVNRQVKSKIQITESEIKSYYKNHLEEFGVKEKIHIAHIFFSTVGLDKKEIENKRKTAEEVLKKLKKGEKFEDLVKKYSEDPFTKESSGDLGWFERNQLLPEIEKAVLSLDPGEISGIIKTKIGFHIVKVLEKTGEIHPDSPEWKEVKKILFKKKFEEKYAKWINELKNKAAIKILY